MKYIKRSLALVLVLIMLLTVMVLPASAVGGSWQETIASFPGRSTNYRYVVDDYTTVIQRFLWCYGGSSRTYIAENGGTDGKYGSGTENAVEDFQAAEGLEADGKVGPNTWRTIAKNLETTVNYQRRLFTENGYNVIRVELLNNPENVTYSYLYYKGTGTGTLGFVFYTE